MCALLDDGVVEDGCGGCAKEWMSGWMAGRDGRLVKQSQVMSDEVETRGGTRKLN